MATTNMPAAVDTFPLATSFGSNGGVGFHSQWAEQVGKALAATEALAISNAAAATSRKRIYVSTLGVTAAQTAAQNTFIFNSASNAETGPCDWVFDAGTTYLTNGFVIKYQYQRIVSSAGGYGGTIFDMRASSGNAVEFQVAPTTYNARLRGCGMLGIKVINTGNTTGAALYIRNMTHAFFERCWFEGFRTGGAINASDFADSIFLGVDFERCGSFTDADTGVVRFGNANDNSLWGVDAIKFIGCRWEVCGDRIFDFRLGTGIGAGLAVNKIHCYACKFENSNTDADGIGGSGSGAQFYFDNCQFINFVGCDFTLQGLRSGHAVLPTIFRMVNTTTLNLTTCIFSFGSGALPKVFTNFFLGTGNAQLLSLTDVWVNSGNSTAFPTKVLSATNTPRLAQKNVGFTPTQGGSKVATDWYTAAEWSSGGIIA